MRHRLKQMYWRGILITLLMSLISTGILVRLKIDDTKSQLGGLLLAASRWTLDSNEDLQSLAESIAGVSPNVRVTFLMDSGLILADSRKESPPPSVSLSDAEIAAARTGGVGYDSRLSGSVYTIFMAKRLSPQLILQVSYPALQVLPMLALYGSVLVILFWILQWLNHASAERFANDQIRQLENVQRLLDGQSGEVQAVFPELKPGLDAISYRIRRLKEDYEAVVQTMKLREDFVANASHELRSPLTSVRGFAEMLQSGLAATQEEQKMCADIICRECDKMLLLIEDILHLEKTGQEPLQPAAPLAVRPVAEEVCQALKVQADQKKITLNVQGDASVRVTEKEMWEILYNITDNAIRYGRDGGTVRIALDGREIMISDDGIGMAAEHLSRIFEPFYRIDDSRSMSASGTGLGLAIIRKLVERRRGSIHAESSPGAGSSFRLHFPEEEGSSLSEKRNS